MSYKVELTFYEVVPFIDVGEDWIRGPHDDQGPPERTSDQDDDAMSLDAHWTGAKSLDDFLKTTPWWISSRVMSVFWDGHSSFMEIDSQVKNADGIGFRQSRSMRKKDLYAAWNAVMRTPRLVRSRLRRQVSRSANDDEKEQTSKHIAGPLPLLEESVGETVVWRRLMDQISDVAYRADVKRLGDERLQHVGEFRHYIVEKYAYNKRSSKIRDDQPDVSTLVSAFYALFSADFPFLSCSTSGRLVCTMTLYQRIVARNSPARSFFRSCCCRSRRLFIQFAVKYLKRVEHTIVLRADRR